MLNIIFYENAFKLWERERERERDVTKAHSYESGAEEGGSKALRERGGRGKCSSELPKISLIMV